ncbi:hypothetical protein [Comamonas sp. JC664]|uniref:hypothetical protein n=1 Tax=Comamonas sp. JC664 TaxID=2801917 RepID=UPI00174BC3EA|nr:hypothetical protein [Comamonas sp. JC664]MBL0698950.1 hypothetical protein [Comamonas sp. JC664]GHG79728.1 hypothetical protein GCM10012319_31880 [Comamonas sp. KCTC 72670]
MSKVRLYSGAMDRCTLVVGERHLQKATQLLPDWWGVHSATRANFTDFESREGIALALEREDRENSESTAHAALHLLWRADLLAMLEGAGAATGVRSADKGRLFRRALERIPTGEPRAHVRRVLTTREGWR